MSAHYTDLGTLKSNQDFQHFFQHLAPVKPASLAPNPVLSYVQRAMREEHKYPVEEAGQRLDHFLVSKSGESRMYLKSLIERSHVLVDGQPITKASTRLKQGSQVSLLWVTPPKIDLTPVNGPLDVLHEDNELLVINKAQGVAAHPAPGTHEPTLVHHLLFHLKENETFRELSLERPGIVHRLDKGTSGIMVIAKTRAAMRSLGEQFQNRTVDKQYEAITWGSMEKAGEIDRPIGRHSKDRKKMSSYTHSPRPASTKWKVIALHPPMTHVGLFPKTGRTHQLRVHLSELEHPIVGDAWYHRRSAAGLHNQLSDKIKLFLTQVEHPFLHAKKLSFDHPLDGDRMEFEVEPPTLFQSLLRLLREDTRPA